MVIHWDYLSQHENFMRDLTLNRSTMKTILLLFLVFSISSCTPCRFKTEVSIRSDLLLDTPIGLSRSSVMPKIQKKHFSSYSHWHENRWRQKAAENEIGPIIICGYLTGLMTSNTYYAEWHFDENDKLTDISVKSRGDGP